MDVLFCSGAGGVGDAVEGADVEGDGFNVFWLCGGGVEVGEDGVGGGAEEGGEPGDGGEEEVCAGGGEVGEADF